MVKKIQNPAWDFVKEVPEDELDYRRGRKKSIHFGAKDKLDDLVFYRDRVTRFWSWAIPDPLAINFIVDMTQDKGVVEIGAGNGYWAWMLSQSGVKVNAYDLHPVGHEKSWFKRLEDDRWSGSGLADYEPEEFYPVRAGSVEALDDPDNHDRVLFLCWPTMDTWAYEAVSRFKGDRIIYIGEGPGGCTASSMFFKAVSGECGCWSLDERHEELCEMVEQAFVEVDSFPIAQWSGINDYVWVYDRKETS